MHARCCGGGTPPGDGQTGLAIASSPDTVGGATNNIRPPSDAETTSMSPSVNMSAASAKKSGVSTCSSLSLPAL
jgi:hypothetical protein